MIMKGLARSCRGGGLLAFLVLSGCGDDVPTPVGSPALLESGADQVMTGLEHILTVEGVREGVVRADTAFFFNDSTMTLLRNPVLELFNAESGVPVARVTAQRGRYNMSTKDLTAYGDVVLVVTEGNKRIESPELHYEPNLHRIWSDSMTVMTDGTGVSQGMGFSSDLEFRNVSIGPGSVRGAGGGRVRF